MSQVADLLFQARMLKEIPRSGFGFLGSGKESVAEPTYSATFIAFVMAQKEADVDSGRLIGMCLVHDLTEARIGDLNTVNKEYVSCDANRALQALQRVLQGFIGIAADILFARPAFRGCRRGPHP